MLSTSIVAFFTAAASLKIIIWMNITNGLDHGLGLAAIGIITFIGTTVSSSIFEEHRHEHGTKHPSNKIIVGKDVPSKFREKLREFATTIEQEEFSKKITKYFSDFKQSKDSEKLKDKIVGEFSLKKSNFIFVDPNNPKKDEEGHFISNVIVGTGIMRKGLAASLVITYIVLIGLSFTAGTLDNSLRTNLITNNFNGTSLDNYYETRNASPNIVIKDIVTIGTNENGTSVLNTDQSSKSIEELLLTKEPSTLVGHFTFVITAVIGFYFGSNTLTALLKARQEDKTSDDLSKILEVIGAKGKITKEKSDKKKKGKED